MPESLKGRKKLVAALAAVAASCVLCAAQGPGSLLPQEERLRSDVEFLSSELCGGRACGTAAYGEAAAYVSRRLSAIPGMGEVRSASFAAGAGKTGHNILAFLPASRPSRSGACILVMASLDGMGKLGDKLYPGADSNASGVAAMIGVAERLASTADRSCTVLFAALDAHRPSCEGASALRDMISSGELTDPSSGKPLKLSSLSLAVSLDILGSSLSPVVKYWKEYLLALGGERYSREIEKCNAGKGLHLTYDYYGSRDFTDLFYRRTGDHRVFLERGVRCVVFTSGITMLTNKVTDTFDTLNYPVMGKRVDLISAWLGSFLR